VCQGGAFGYLATFAAQAMPGLPITELRDGAAPAWWLASGDAIAAEAARIADQVIDGLVMPAGALIERARSYPAARPLDRAADGLLLLEGDDPSETFTRRCAEWRLGDGLPLVAPTPERVAAMLGAIPGELEVWPVVAPRTSSLMAREVAVIAVMAGCEPRWWG